MKTDIALTVCCVWNDRPWSSPCQTKERHIEGAYATIRREELATTVSNLTARVEALERKPQVQFVPPIQPPQFTVTTNLMTGPNAWGVINNTGLLAYTNGVSINGVGWLTP